MVSVGGWHNFIVRGVGGTIVFRDATLGQCSSMDMFVCCIKVSLYIQGSPSGCVRREIPGVTQFEKGHEGNTAVVTAYLCWREHGIYRS